MSVAGAAVYAIVRNPAPAEGGDRIRVVHCVSKVEEL